MQKQKQKQKQSSASSLWAVHPHHPRTHTHATRHSKGLVRSSANSKRSRQRATGNLTRSGVWQTAAHAAAPQCARKTRFLFQWRANRLRKTQRRERTPSSTAQWTQAGLPGGSHTPRAHSTTATKQRGRPSRLAAVRKGCGDGVWAGRPARRLLELMAGPSLPGDGRGSSNDPVSGRSGRGGTDDGSKCGEKQPAMP
jgi:hypothetical protein